ncbi:MAG: hypothetical protein RLZZ156_728, partial [Deinococcota bacterium]
MRKSKFIQGIVGIGTLGLMFACQPPVPPPLPVALPQTVNGTIAQWSSTSSGVLKSYLAKDQAALAQSGISSTGAFSLELPVVTTLSAGVGNVLRGCANPDVTANPTDLKLSSVVTWAVESSSLFAGEVNPNKTNNPVRWIFSDKASTVTGTEICLGMTTKGDAVYTYSLNLTLGWNAYQITKTADKAYTVSSLGLSEALTWVFSAYQDLRGLVGGADTGSINNRIKGSLPTIDINQMLLRISVGYDSSYNNLTGILPTGLDFDTVLPNTVDPAYLGLVADYLRPAEGCTNAVTNSNPTAKSGILDVLLFKNGIPSHQALLRSYAHEVQWWYVDQATTVSGFQTCSGSRAIIQKYNLQLQVGWNAIVVSLDDFGAVQLFRTITIPSGSQWFPTVLTGDNTFTPSGYPFAGTIVNWTDTNGNPLPEGVLQANFRTVDPQFFNRPLQTTAIKAGVFDFFVPKEVSSEMKAIEFQGVCNKVFAIPNTIKGAKLYLDVRVAGQQIALLNAQNGNQRFEWFYASADSQVSATEQCNVGGVTYSEEYNLSLKQGWNTLIYTQLEQTATVNRQSITVGTASSIQWSLQRIPLTLGSAASSTKTSLQGQILNPKALAQTLKVVILPDTELDLIQELGSVSIAANGDFSLALPNSLDPSLFIPLSFDDPDCTGLVNYSNPNAAGTPLDLEISDAQGQYITTPIPIFVDNVNNEKVEFAWWFLDSATNISGQQTCTDTTTGEIANVTFSLTLQAGWNLIGVALKGGTYTLRSYE